MEMTTLIIVGVIVLIAIITIIGILSRYRKCKSDELLVVYGKTGSHKEKVNELDAKGNQVSREVEIKTARVYHGGAAFVWPIIQGYEVMSMRPIQLNLTLKDALSAQNIRVTVPTTVTVAISQDPLIMQNAANRLLGVDDTDKESLISDIVYGQMRLIVASMEIEELNSNRDKFLTQARDNINTELNKLGLYLININISDIRDAANYIENLGQKETTKARAQAEAAIAEEEKKGAIQIALTTKERETKVAETTRDQKVAIAITLKDQETTIAETNKDKAIRLAETTKEQEVKLSEQQKEQCIAIADQQKEQEVGVAKANTEKLSKVAEQESIAISQQTEWDAQAKANMAKSKAEAAAKEQEAESAKQIRIAAAQQNQEAETIKAVQEKEARTAEYESEARKKTAEANKQAGVAEHIATIEVSKAKGEAAKAAADADKVAGISKVDAETTIARTEQEKIAEIKEAEAKAKEAELNATVIVPANKAKEKAIIDAEAVKQEAILKAEAKAAEILKEAEAKADATKLQLEAEAEGTKRKLLAEAEGKRASLMAEADKITAVEMAPAKAVEKMIECGMTPQMIVQYKTVDQLKGIAEASAEMYEHIHLGQVTVYGNENTAGSFMAKTAENLNPAFELLKSIPFKKTFKEMFVEDKKDNPTEDNFEAVK